MGDKSGDGKREESGYKPLKEGNQPIQKGHQPSKGNLNPKNPPPGNPQKK